MVLKRVLLATGLAIMMTLVMSFPVLAIANPDSIGFSSSGIGRYKVFENVNETGDMLFVAECWVDYDPAPGTPGEKAGEAFQFQILNAAGDTIILQTPIAAYFGVRQFDKLHQPAMDRITREHNNDH